MSAAPGRHHRDIELRRSNRRAADPDPEPPAPSASPNVATTASASAMFVGDATRAAADLRSFVVIVIFFFFFDVDAAAALVRRRLHRVAPLARAPSVPPLGEFEVDGSET